MEQSAVPSDLPDFLVERVQFAKAWWGDDQTRPLPGEDLGHTVFVIKFYDGCKVFGYTKEDVTYRAASMAAHLGGWSTHPFVEEHARCVPYVVRCIRSGMDQSGARQLRSLLVSLASANKLVGSKTMVETADCWISGAS